MVVLDATIVNIALPSAQQALHFSNDNRQWIVTAYALAFGSLLLIGGRISDLFGRKWTFIVGLFPVWPTGFAVSEKIKVHIDLMSGFTGCATSGDGSGGQFATDARRPGKRSDYARVRLHPEANSAFSCYLRRV